MQWKSTALVRCSTRAASVVLLTLLASVVCFAGADADADIDGDGFSPATGDCNEGTPLQNPGAPELCDGFDNDCDGVLDDVPFCHPLCVDTTLSPDVPLTPLDESTSLVTDRVLVAGPRLAALWHIDQGVGVHNLGYQLTLLDRDGGNPTTSLVGLANGVDVVWTGEQYGIVGATCGDGSSAPWFRRIAAGGDVTGPVDLPDSARIAWTGTEFILAYASTLQRFDRDGNPLGDPVPYPEGRILELLTVGDHLAAVVESAGAVFKFVRLALDGTLLGPPGVLL